MVDRVIARLQIKGRKYEISVDCEKAMQIRSGKSQDVNSALLVDNIFKDIKKGEVAGDLERDFGTDDIGQISMRIIKEGEVQVSASYREKQTEMLRNKVVDEIALMAIDGTTNLPIPRQRIEMAMKQIHYNFDLNRPESQQVDQLLSELKKVLPIKLGEFEYTVEVPIQYSNEAMLNLKRLTNIKKNARNENTLVVDFSVKAGNESEIISRLKSVTHGSAAITKRGL